MRRFAKQVMVAALVGGVAACAKGGDQEEPSGAPAGGTAAAPPTSAAPMGGDSGAGQAADAMDDGQILAVLDAMNQTEILPSQVAQQNAQNPQLKEYATRMVTEHTTLGDSMRALGIAPTPHPLAESMRATAQATTQRLQAMQGMDFDTAYAAAMATSHQQGLQTLQERLLPRAQSAQLRAALEQKVRPAVEAHLQQIQQIQGTLGGGGGQP